MALYGAHVTDNIIVRLAGNYAVLPLPYEGEKITRFQLLVKASFAW